MARNKRYPKGILLVLASLGFAACTEVIDIELDSTYQRLVVVGIVTSDSVHHHVQLTTSSDYFSNKPSPKVSGALVALEFDNNLILLEEHDTIPGLYLTPAAFRGTPQTAYNLNVSNIDIDGDGVSEIYRAESTMPSALQLDSIRLTYFESSYFSGYQVFMYALDPPSREWYSFKIWKNSDLLTDTLSKFSVQPDDFFNGTYIYGLPVGFLWDEDPREALVPGDTVTLELNSIDQDYYNFIMDAQLEIMGNNPLFSGPAANVRSNIDNQGQGIFTAYPVQKVWAVLTE